MGLPRPMVRQARRYHDADSVLPLAEVHRLKDNARLTMSWNVAGGSPKDRRPFRANSCGARRLPRPGRVKELLKQAKSRQYDHCSYSRIIGRPPHRAASKRIATARPANWRPCEVWKAVRPSGTSSAATGKYKMSDLALGWYRLSGWPSRSGAAPAATNFLGNRYLAPGSAHSASDDGHRRGTQM